MAETELYYVSILAPDKVYVLDKAKYIQYSGSKADVRLVKAAQLHDDDSEIERLFVEVAGKRHPCYAARVFATEADFEEWRRV